MRELVKLENYNGNYVVSSRVVANGLGKRHSDVLRDIRKMSENQSTQICVDLEKIIIPNTYADSKNRNYREYLLTKDGFTLYMFNIQGYLDFKMAYINEFNRMAQELKSKTLPFENNAVMIPVSKANYWQRIKELSEYADNERDKLYKKLNQATKLITTMTKEVDRLSDIVFETENCIKKLER